MFSAIGRFFRTLSYWFSGRIDSSRKELSQDPHVIQATYDNVIREKKQRIHQYKDAVAAMIAQEEKKLSKLRELTNETERLEKLKAGAAAKAKSVVEQLKSEGKSMEEIKAHEDYKKCLAAFNDFTSTLNEKSDHIAELEADSKELNENIASHKVQLQNLQREIAKLKEEASATVADVITSKEEQEINDMLSGISEETHAKELEEMREIREQQKAKARISREMAGTDVKRLEDEFLDYANSSVSTNEFDQLIGLAEEAETQAATETETAAKTKLPEA